MEFIPCTHKKENVCPYAAIFGSKDSVKKGCVGYQEEVLLKSFKTVRYSQSMFHIIFCLAI